jgi:hypothetical protein
MELWIDDEPGAERLTDAMELFDKLIGGWEHANGASNAVETQQANGRQKPFDPHAYLIAHSETAAAQKAQYGPKPDVKLVCCNQVKLLEILDGNTCGNRSDVTAINLLNDFVRDAPLIRLRPGQEARDASPDYLIVVADRKTKSIHWFTRETSTTEDGKKIPGKWAEFDRAEAKRPRFIFLNALSRISSTYSPVKGIGQKALFCAVHDGAHRWSISVGRKDPVKEQADMDQSLFPMGFLGTLAVMVSYTVLLVDIVCRANIKLG